MWFKYNLEMNSILTFIIQTDRQIDRRMGGQLHRDPAIKPTAVPTHIMCSLHNKPLSCWTRIYTDFANSVDPDQLASEEANWSGSALFAIKYVNL